MEAFIIDAVRTPRGRGKAENGSLNSVSPVELASVALGALKGRNDLAADVVEDVVLGCVEPIGDQGADIARSAALKAGLGEGVAGMQLNRFCASGLEACAIGAALVAAGQRGLVIGGGVEMMSRIPMGASGYPPLTDPSIAVPHSMIPQGVAADLLATLRGHSREELDAYAVESQRRASRAWKDGRFDQGIAPVVDACGLLILGYDEAIRPDADMQFLDGYGGTSEIMKELASRFL